MASNSALDQKKRKGTNTEEYQKVKSNMTSSIASIRVIPGAAESLTMQFIQKEWLPSYAKDISAENLIIQALNRIKNDAAEHGVLLEMLGNIDGTDQIVASFTVTQEESAPIQSNLPAAQQRGEPEVAYLGYDDLFKVKCQVLSLTARWKHLGQALGLVPSELDIIERGNRELEDCLDKALSLWLKQNYDTEEYGKPSWTVLARAVRHPAGGNNTALADEIKKLP